MSTNDPKLEAKDCHRLDLLEIINEHDFRVYILERPLPRKTILTFYFYFLKSRFYFVPTLWSSTKTM